MTKSIGVARDGSSSVLGQLLNQYRDYLLQVARSELDGRLEPKVAYSDAVQETFLQAARDFPKFIGTSESELRSWLRQILRHNLHDYYRQYQASKKRAIDCEVPLISNGSTLHGHELACDESTASQKLMRAEDHERLLAAIGRLPEDYRRAVQLRSVEELSFEQVAAEMGRTSEAVRKLWSRGIEWLAAEIAPDDV